MKDILKAHWGPIAFNNPVGVVVRCCQGGQPKLAIRILKQINRQHQRIPPDPKINMVSGYGVVPWP